MDEKGRTQAKPGHFWPTGAPEMAMTGDVVIERAQTFALHRFARNRTKEYARAAGIPVETAKKRFRSKPTKPPADEVLRVDADRRWQGFVDYLRTGDPKFLSPHIRRLDDRLARLEADLADLRGERDCE